MLLLLLPQGPAIAGVDLANTINDILPTLGASGIGDLDWCTQAELYQWADEAAKRLSHRVGVFVTRDTSTNLLIGEATYPVPTGHVATVHVTVLPTSKLSGFTQDQALERLFVGTSSALCQDQSTVHTFGFDSLTSAEGTCGSTTTTGNS